MLREHNSAIRFCGFILIGLETSLDIESNLRHKFESKCAAERVKETFVKTGFHFFVNQHVQKTRHGVEDTVQVFGESQTMERCLYGNSRQWSAVKTFRYFMKQMSDLFTPRLYLKRSVIR